MKWGAFVLCLTSMSACWASTGEEQRREAEYYVAAYAKHYNVPVEFVRAVVEQESGWRRCVVSTKGAAGLMQLMPATAARLSVRNRCDINQNVSGGVRYLAWLMNRFHGDMRLVAAAYYVGENTIQRRGLGYSNPDVVAYVASVRQRFTREKSLGVRIFSALQGEHDESAFAFYYLSNHRNWYGANPGRSNHSYSY